MHLKTFEQLREEINAAKDSIEVGAQYRHYKNKHIYTVLGISVIEASEEVAVRYVDIDEPGVEFIRPVEQWNEPQEGGPRFIRMSQDN